MNTLFFMYDVVSVVRSGLVYAHNIGTEIIHKKSSLHMPAERHHVAEAYDTIREVFMRDCTVLSPQQYLHDRFIMSDRPLFLEFQSMDNIHEGETVMVNVADIMSFGGTSNDGGVYLTTFSGVMLIMPIELKTFAQAHEWHRAHGRSMPTQHQAA